MISSLALLFINSNRLETKKNRAIALESKLQGQNNHGKENNSKANLYEKNADRIDDSNAIGVIRIDDIDVVMPIFSNTDEDSLLEGCGVLDDTDFPSDKEDTISVLSGHRGGRNDNFSFMNIDKLKEGSKIKITTENQILYYEVYGYEIIDSTDWSRFVREKDKAKLYLMSCHPYPYNYQRLLVKSELKDYVDKTE